MPSNNSASRINQSKRLLLLVLLVALLGLLLTVVLVGVIELILRGVGMGRETARFVKRDSVGQSVWIDNPAFALRFFPGPWYPDSAPVQVPVAKAPDSLRVVVVGESAAFGYPDPAFGFARMLEAALEQAYPGRDIELINAAQSGVNSHVLVEVVRDVLALDPDLLVIYAGNNEFIGPYGAGNPGGAGALSSSMVRASVMASRLRMIQFVKSEGSGRTGTDPMACELIAPDSLAARESLRRFEENLEAMVDAADSRAVPVVLCTVAVNERDWTPFGDVHRIGISDAERKQWEQHWQRGIQLWAEHRHDEAALEWKRAEEIDPTPATLQHALARSAVDEREAEQRYRDALTQDARPYRVTPAMNERIRLLAGKRLSALQLADCDASLKRDGKGGQYFVDHCHFSQEGNLAVARCIARAVTSLLPCEKSTAIQWDAVPMRLGCNAWHEREGLRYARHLLDRPPYSGRWLHEAWMVKLDQRIMNLEASASALLAESPAPWVSWTVQHPDDLWLARNAAQLWQVTGDGSRTLQCLEEMLERHPAFARGWAQLAEAQSQAGKHESAALAWRAACILRPESSEWRVLMAASLAAAGDTASALQEYQSLARGNPLNPDHWWNAGQMQERQNDYADAIATYREGLIANPAHAGLHYYLAKALRHEAQLEEARDVAKAGLLLDPANDGLRKLIHELGET